MPHDEMRQKYEDINNESGDKKHLLMQNRILLIVGFGD